MTTPWSIPVSRRCDIMYTKATSGPELASSCVADLIWKWNTGHTLGPFCVTRMARLRPRAQGLVPTQAIGVVICPPPGDSCHPAPSDATIAIGVIADIACSPAPSSQAYFHTLENWGSQSRDRLRGRGGLSSVSLGSSQKLPIQLSGCGEKDLQYLKDGLHPRVLVPRK